MSATADARTSHSGIGAVGDLAWGTHFCQFYRTRQDLVDTLVPYLHAGLRDNEFCMWVTSDPLGPDEAKAAMRAAVPEFDDYLDRGQIEIWDHRDWYLPDGRLSYKRVFGQWVDKEKKALDGGFTGLRLTGNTAWLDRAGWDDFVHYESEVNRSFGAHRIIGLCTYSLDGCCAQDVLDVVQNHEFALVRRHGAWEQMETAAVKAQKRELLQENRELERRVAERTAELEAAVRGRDQFLAMLAHELRNPLAPIVNGLHVLGLDGVRPEDVRKTCQVMARQASHMGRMVDDLLEVSRVTAGRVKLLRQRVDLVEVVRGAGEDHRAVAAASAHQLRLSLPAGPLWADVDTTRLSQVISNLLNNALKFSDAGTEVGLSVREHPPGSAEISVSDHGTGIEPEMLRRIFEPFSQADRSLDRSRGGLGLGLALVKGLVALHGGSVRAESAGPGRGATFTVQLPLDRPEPPAKTDAPRAAPQRRGLRVLVVEDHVDSAQMMQLMLELKGHAVRLAHTGPDGVAAALEHRPDVVLCDIGLPGLDGYEVARRLRAEPALRGASLVAITGYGQSDDVRAAREAGFDTHLTKPVEPQRLEAVLAEAATPAPAH